VSIDFASVAMPDLFDGIADELAAEVEAFLASQRRTAHPLVSLTTAELVAQALGTVPAGPSAPTAPGVGVSLPRGLWRVLPDRLLALHPARRGEGVARLRITTTEHLQLTALVLERWGWAQSGRSIRTAGGRRCILGAQAAVHRLGYGTHDTAVVAGHRLNNVLAARGIRLPYQEWNELPHVTRDQALALVRQAAKEQR
jgi:hypothetical protein